MVFGFGKSKQDKILNAAKATGTRISPAAGTLAERNSNPAINSRAVQESIAQQPLQDQAAILAEGQQTVINYNKRNQTRKQKELQNAANEKARLASMTSAERAAEKKQLNMRNRTTKNLNSKQQAYLAALDEFNKMSPPGTFLEDPNKPYKMDPVGLKHYNAGLKWCEKQWAQKAKALGVPPITLGVLDDAVVKLIQNIKGHPEKFDELVKKGALGTSELKQVLLNAAKGREIREAANAAATGPAVAAANAALAAANAANAGPGANAGANAALAAANAAAAATAVPTNAANGVPPAVAAAAVNANANAAAANAAVAAAAAAASPTNANANAAVQAAAAAEVAAKAAADQAAPPANAPANAQAPPAPPSKGGKRSKTRKQSKKRKASRKVRRH